MNIVIVGLSAGGLSCLKTLLKYSKDINITAITNEDRIYSRCLLTYLLGRELGEKDINIADINDFRQINLITGKNVTEIKREKKTIVLEDGKEISYDKLILAVGADPLRPTYTKEENNVFTLRYLREAVKIEKRLKNSVVVVGGGYVGIKSAYGFYKRKVYTTMVVTSPYPLSVTADEETGRVVEKELIKMKIDLKLKSDVIDISKKEGLAKVTLRDETEIHCDAVIVGKGVKPNIKLAKNAGLDCENGILVNEYLQTSDKDIFAIGDCAESFDIIRKERYINAIWPVAEEQGYFCALNILGRDVSYPGSISMNSLKMENFHLITAGLLKGDGIKTHTLWHKNKNQFRKIALKDDLLVGVAFLNNPEDAGVYVNLIKKGDTRISNPEEFLTTTPVSYYKI
ncbi:MAG: FAD-dependent oxidoreductase [Proteobacteria bacterium]|nr:FAD-dependent oxidoreductase [Pseudomonadota bacterium]